VPKVEEPEVEAKNCTFNAQNDDKTQESVNKAKAKKILENFDFSKLFNKNAARKGKDGSGENLRKNKEPL